MDLTLEYIELMKELGFTLTDKSCCDSFIENEPIFTVDGYDNVTISRHKCRQEKDKGRYYITKIEQVTGGSNIYTEYVDEEVLYMGDVDIDYVIDNM